jgi:hypothetical protein
MASLSDILTAAKNVVTSVNQLGRTYLIVNGFSRSQTMTATTLVSSGQGRIASVSVVIAGSSDCVIYDSNSTSSLTSPLAAVTNAVGVKVINMPYNNGLVVVPGTGMTVVVSYSEESSNG